MGLFNGDTGIIDFNEERTRLIAYFEQADGVRAVQTSRLPAFEPVFVMTVHKSQGSEFDRIGLMLPPERSPVFTRELLYTAVTRARQGVTLIGTRASITAGLGTRVSRASGLRDALWR
jgi:exodeoxyribonuclease V alpha subunit